MRNTFCGHSNSMLANEVQDKLIGLLKQYAEQNETVELYIGAYGEFDHFVARCASSVKPEYPNLRSFLIIPYLFDRYLKGIENIRNRYDDVIYAPVEEVPYRLAILKCNEWMVNESDLVIAFVRYDWGGAWKTLQYAKRKKKEIINLSEK